MKLEIINSDDKSSDNLYGDIMEGYLDPMELIKDKAEAEAVVKAIDLVRFYASQLEDKIEIC